MNRNRQLQICNTAASAYNAGLVLMVQLGWRLWRHVGREEFPAYHRAWWFGVGGIQPILWPGVGIHALGSVAQLRWRSPAVPKKLPWVILGLQVISGALTATWWGAQQARMDHIHASDGSLTPQYRRLMATHWLRVGLIMAAAACQAWMASRTIEGREA